MRKPYNKPVREQMPLTTTLVSHSLTGGAELQSNSSTLPKAQPYPLVTVQAEATSSSCSPDHHSPMAHPCSKAAEKQQKVPAWLKTDNVVGVKIPGFHDPMTGMVKFVGVVQVKGDDKLIAGVQLVSFMQSNPSK